MRKHLITLLAISFSLASYAQQTWTIDRGHSKIGFSVSHMVVAETEGYFKDFEGTITTNSDDFANAEVSFTAKAASINTDNERRDNHLRSADFFDVEKYPEVKFVGKLIKEGDKYVLKGDFTMKNVTKAVVFDVKYGGSINTGRGMKAGFKLSGTVNRQDYGIAYANKMTSGDMVVGDEVSLSCKIELDKK